MIHKLSLKALAIGTLAVAGLLSGIQRAEAGPVRLKFDPEYGAPFPNLSWRGEAIVNDGLCTDSGSVSNLFGTCRGQFTFESATVFFKDTSTDVEREIAFTGGQVLSVQRVSREATDWREVVSTPFNTEVVEIDATLYDPNGDGLGTQAYFSLIFIGGFAQLYWFQNDPGDFLRDDLRFPYLQGLNAYYYGACFKAGPGDHKVGLGKRFLPYNQCGLSSNVGGDGDGGRLGFEAAVPVPEPGTLALVLAAGLGAVGLKSRRRGRTT